MPKSNVVHIPNATADRPTIARIAATVAGGLAAGLVIAFTTAPAPERRPKDDGSVTEADVVAEEATAASPTAPVTERDVEKTDASPAIPDKKIAEEEAPVEDRVMAEEARADDHDEKVSESAKVDGELRYLHDRVAYLRCEGVPPAPGPFPCPRDPKLEREARAVLSTVSECPGAIVSQIDVRLDFRRREETGVRVLQGRDSVQEVDTDAVYECVVDRLTPLKTTLDPEHMVVSFRFELKPRP
jgi:hypothetical protein